MPFRLPCSIPLAAAALLVASLAVGPLKAQAADMLVRKASDDPSVSVIAFSGEIKVRDGEKFAAIIKNIVRGVVVFSSPGGSVFDGLQIGQLIRIHHLATFVSDGTYCASACALAWLSGAPRFVQATSQVGFHAAFQQHGRKKTESGVANAVIGAYLNTLGFSINAIVYIEKAHPDQITWLTMEDARRLGIEVTLLPSDKDAPAEASRRAGTEAAPPARVHHDPSLLLPDLTPPAGPDQAIEDQARRFVADYFAHWSEGGAEALAYFAASYADHVTFYGHMLDRDAVMAGKRSFAERWPLRVYTVQSDTFDIFCNPANHKCTISGIVDWDCRNPSRNAETTGSANFSLTVAMTDGAGAILAESGSVIDRRIN
jgi:hypothetical protein